MKNFAALSLLVALLCLAAPAFSQGNYHYSYGGSRVVNQGHTGLYLPAATQIGAGTISKSAQGYSQSGAIINPGLPPVPMGSHVTTAGDAQYQTGFAPGTGMPNYPQQHMVVAPNVAGTAIWNAGLPGVNFGSHVGTAGDAMRSDLHPEINDRNQSWWHPQPQQTYSVQQVRYAPTGAAGAATYESQGGSSGALTY